MKRSGIIILSLISVFMLVSCGSDPGYAFPASAEMASMANRPHDPFDEIPELMRRWLADNSVEPVIEEPLVINVIGRDYGVSAVTPFENGYSWVNIGGRWGLVNENGDIAIPAEYEDYVRSGSDIHLKKDGLWGVVDIHMNVIIPFEYEDINGAGNILTVRKDGRAGFIDRGNNVIIPPKYDSAGVVINGVAMVGSGGRFGAVNMDDEIVVSVKYTQFVYQDDRTIVMKDQDKYVVFDINGYWTTPYAYDRAVPADGLIIVEQDGKAGVIDAWGNTIYPIIFDEIYDVRDGVMCVVIDGMATVMDRFGSPVLPEMYDDVFYNGGGLIYASRDGRTGVFDLWGRAVIPMRYDLIMEFGPNERVTWFMRSWEENRWGVIDRAGNILMEPRYYDVRGFSEGLALVNFGDNWGYVNELGQGAIADDFDLIPGMGQFGRGVALVSQDGHFGYIDKNGNIIIPAEYSAAHEFGQNSRAWAETDGRWVILELAVPEVILTYSGVSFILEPVYEFDSVSPFINGFSLVGWNNAFGVARADGELIIPPVYYEVIYDALEDPDHFLVRNHSGNYGYISTSGAIVIPPEYDSLLRVPNGFIVSQADRFGYIDMAGNNRVPLEYDGIAAVSDNLLAARDGNRWACVTTEGEFITDFRYDSISESANGLIKVSRNRRYGFINENGDEVIPLLYDEAHLAGDSFIIIREGAGRGIIDIYGNVTTPPDYTRVEFFGETGVILANENGYSIVAEYYTVRNAVEIDCDDIYAVNDKIAIARKGHRYGIVNAFGDILIPLGLDSVSQISEELLIIRLAGKQGLMSAEGIVLLLPVYDFVFQISEDILAVADGNMYGLIDKTGDILFMQELTDTWVFSDTLSIWLRYAGVLEVAGHQGEIIFDAVNFIYDKAVGTRETMYLAMKDGKFGYVDVDGNVLLPIIHDMDWTFNDDMSMWLRYVPHAGEWEVTGRQGESILRPEALLYDFAYGGANIHQVLKDGKTGYINVSGEIVIAIEFDEITYSEDGTAIAVLNARYGYIDRDGSLLTPVIYESVTEFGDNVSWVRIDGKWGILYLYPDDSRINGE